MIGYLVLAVVAIVSVGMIKTASKPKAGRHSRSASATKIGLLAGLMVLLFMVGVFLVTAGV